MSFNSNLTNIQSSSQAASSNNNFGTMYSQTSNKSQLRKRKPLDLYPLKSPYAIQLLIQDVLPSFKKWTRSSFKNVLVNGISTPWLDVFNNTIQKQFPILCPYFLVKHYKNLPKILLHSMYALVLDTLKTKDDVYPPGDAHYVYCKALYQGKVSNPLEIVALIYMGFHAAAFSPSLIAGISFFSVAASHASEMGMFQNKNFIWDMNGFKYGKDSRSGIKLRQMIAVQLYRLDFYAAHLRRITFSLTESDLHPKLLEYVDDGNIYNEYYQSQLWIDEFALFSVARIVSAVSDRQDLEPLHKEITDWSSGRIALNLSSQTFNSNKMQAIVLKLSANYLQMFLTEPEFMEALLLQDAHNPILETCFGMAKETAELASQLIGPVSGVSCYSIQPGCYTALDSAGTILAFLQAIVSYRLKTEFYYQMCRQMMVTYVKHFQFTEYRLQMVELIKLDPQQALLRYAQK